jgi:MSHA biogenesis protein MshE
MARAVVSRIKILSGLDIAERRLPQDGRARIKVEARNLDLRIATMPTVHGEAVAIRLLENMQRVLDLTKLGFSAEEEAVLRKRLAAPHGLMLVTGPTGSGKTTTLAAALTILNEPHRKILTIEDPIEYQIEGINQTQVRPDIGMSFANALRHLLRHDPDVIMVGEMRDTETAQIGLRAAITGHMVLSTLHTRDAAGAPTRMLDMGVPRFMVATALQAVIAQRLVRLVCEGCAEEHAPSAQEARFLEAIGAQAGGFKRGRGCGHCNGSGYRGRHGVYEMLEMTARLTQAVAREDVTAFMAAARDEMAGQTFVQHAVALAAAGRTSLAEVMRISQAED